MTSTAGLFAGFYCWSMVLHRQLVSTPASIAYTAGFHFWSVLLVSFAASTADLYWCYCWSLLLVSTACLYSKT